VSNRSLALAVLLACPGIVVVSGFLTAEASAQAVSRTVLAQPPAREALRRASPEPREGGARAPLRVCSDPENMPFSNRKLEGFENRIAALIAKELGTTVSYIWWGQRRGFVRNTMDATLQKGRCDVVIGVPDGYDLVSTTPPYYRSTYVFVYPKGKRMAVKSLDDPVLKKLKIGVHLLGDDYTNPPPVHELGKRGIVDNVVGFSTFYSAENPPSTIIDAVAGGTIDLAIVWGPIAGYFASRQSVPMDLAPVPSGRGDLPFAFNISMGVRKGDDALKARVERVRRERGDEITAILKEYGVPLLNAGRNHAK
jgi:quinoprotein dehydrogenase-associated probable ABC transporter substrate-binding protein